MPSAGRPKAPNTPDNPRVGARLKQAGQAVDIDFTGACDTTPNTVQAHALLEYVLERHGSAAQNAVQEALFRAYFTDGVCPMGADTLAQLAAAAVPEWSEEAVAAVRQYLKSGEGEAKAMSRARSMSKNGIRGVPFFFVNGEAAFSGAQHEDAFVDVFEKALEQARQQA
eukprot:g6548.t1